MIIAPKAKKYLLFLLVLLLLPGTAAAAVKVAVLPFQINADQDYAFLQKGIQDMLASRLANPGEVEIIEPQAAKQTLDALQGLSGDNKAVQAGVKLQADYVLQGSITILGNNLSIDAKMLDVRGARNPLTFFKQTQSLGEVIPQIDILANEINEQVFHRKTAPPAAAQSPAAPQPIAPQASAQQESRMHPEKLLQRNPILGGETQSPLARQESGSAHSLNPAFISPAGGASQGPAFWKSRNFDHLLTGIAVADVNNDGIQETVVASPDNIYIYQFVQGRMTAIKTIEAESFTYPISVDAADINGNGMPEIFVTSLTSGRNRVKSSVIEFDGAHYKTIVADARWYFRVVKYPDRGDILLGQAQHAGDDAFGAPIVELNWKGADYEPGDRILPGGKASLLGLAIGDVMNEKDVTVVALNKDDHLRIMNLNGKEIWTGSDYLGGSPEHLILAPKDVGSIKSKSWLPVRVRVTDLEKDGKFEVIAIANEDLAHRRLAQQRIFRNGHLTALVWNGLGLTTAWQTRNISGRIQDFAVADFDNDGKEEILCAVISKEGAVIGTEAKSTLIAYELAQ